MTLPSLLHGYALEYTGPLMPLWPYGDAALTLAMGAGLGLLVAVAMLLRQNGVSADATRTFVHVLTALAVAAVPWLFASPLGPMTLALVFAAVNLWAIRHRKLDALHAARPASYGTVAMPLALVFAFVLFEPRTTGFTATAWTIAWTILALADPVAGAVGRRYGHGGAKSWAGSAAFFVVAFATSLAGLILWQASQGGPVAPRLATNGDGVGPLYPPLLAHAAAAAAVATACEWLGRRGWDNLFVVLGVYFALVTMAVRYQLPDAAWAWMPVVGALAFAGAAYRLRWLSGSGAVAAGLFAWLVLLKGGWPYLLSGAGFFVLSSLLSRWNRRRSASVDAIAEKGHRRDAAQVAANGFVAAVALALGHGPLVLAAWVGAFAAAAADTWGTEIGTRFGGTPRLVTTGRKVPAGTSGGISAAGLLGGLAGAAVVGTLAWIGLAMIRLEAAVPFAGSVTFGQLGAVAAHPLRTFAAWTAVALAAGLTGSLFDSLLGATVQRRFRCADGTLTEKPTTDGLPNEPAGGWRWMTNDTVNFAATLVGALVASFLDLSHFLMTLPP